MSTSHLVVNYVTAQIWAAVTSIWVWHDWHFSCKIWSLIGISLCCSWRNHSHNTLSISSFIGFSNVQFVKRTFSNSIWVQQSWNNFVFGYQSLTVLMPTPSSYRISFVDPSLSDHPITFSICSIVTTIHFHFIILFSVVLNTLINKVTNSIELY